jgi:hypothetical protein
MKNLNILIILGVILIFTVSCEQPEVIQERPGKIVATEVEPDVLEELDIVFPERVNFADQHPYLFADSVNHNIVLTEDSEVYLTFVSEGAGLKNSLGYYIYNPSNKIVTVSELNLNILFPNISNNILDQGDMLQLGDKAFPAGTMVGFFLIVDGWRAGSVNFDNETFYTDIYLNLEEVQQHVLFKFENFGSVVLAFEDKFVNGGGTDQDYNDVVFTLSDNRAQQPTTRFNLEAIPTLVK